MGTKIMNILSASKAALAGYPTADLQQGEVAQSCRHPCHHLAPAAMTCIKAADVDLNNYWLKSTPARVSWHFEKTSVEEGVRNRAPRAGLDQSL
jgi:hypothetical protein